LNRRFEDLTRDL